MPSPRELVGRRREKTTELAIVILIVVLTFCNENSRGDSPTEDCSLSLDLTGVGLQGLRDGFIKNDFLTNLTLDRNEISIISSAAFTFMPRLSYLSLADNKPSVLDFHLFSELPNLETLILNGNCKLPPPTEEPHRDGRYYPQSDPYSYDSARSYGEQDACHLHFNVIFRNLTHLHVENNDLQELKFSSGELPVLTHLYLSHNLLQMREETMLGLNRIVPNLMHLYLQHCAINELNVSQLPTLTSLHLDNNNILAICNEYCDYPSLKLKSAQKLEVLSVSYNRISKIEIDSFNYTTNLLTLDLSQNQIWEIREGTFDKLRKLRSLSLENNHATLNSVHTFRGLINLENLSLGGNDLSNIPSGFFGNLSSLKKLMLNSTKISSINSETFSKLSRLEVLFLADNQLSIIPDGSMPASGSLIILILDDNNFTSTDQISPSNTQNMIYLSLRNNPLKTIKGRWFLNTSQAFEIRLEPTLRENPNFPTTPKYVESETDDPYDYID